MFQELEEKVNDSPDRTLDGILAGFWRSVIQHQENGAWSVTLFKNNTKDADITHTARSLDDLVLEVFRNHRVDISHTRELKSQANRALMVSVGLTRKRIKRLLRESGIEPTEERIAEAVQNLREAARAAAQIALTDFIKTKKDTFVPSA